MQHRLSIDGLGYSLRPVQLSDARFILKIRLEDMNRTQYIHEIPDDIELEENWIRKYFNEMGIFSLLLRIKSPDSRKEQLLFMIWRMDELSGGVGSSKRDPLPQLKVWT